MFYQDALNMFYQVKDLNADHKGRQSLIADQSEDVIIRYKLLPKAHMEYINPAVKHLTRYKPEIFFRHPRLALGLIHPDDRLQFMPSLAHPGKLEHSNLYRLKTKNGDLRWIKTA